MIQILKTITQLFLSFLFILIAGLALALTNIGFLLSLLAYPFSKKSFYFLTSKVFSKNWIHFSGYLAEKLLGLKINVKGDIQALQNYDRAFLMANHQSALDVISLFVLTKKFNKGGHLKWMAKDVLKYVPGIGTGMWFLQCIFLKRNWNSDINRIHNTFSLYREAKFPFWLVSFSEGTRLSLKKLKTSQQFQVKNNLTKTNYVLAPRTKGFAATVLGLKGNFEGILDLTYLYPSFPAPTLFKNLILGFGRPITIDIIVKAYPASSFESLNEKDLNKWPIERFLEKDNLLTEHHS